MFCRIWFRLYWFPTKVLYSSAAVSVIVYPGGPFYVAFNIMLTLLYIMQVYWFGFIVALIMRVMVGGKVEDIREDLPSDETEKKENDSAIVGSSKEPEDARKPASGTPKTRKRKPKAGTS